MAGNQNTQLYEARIYLVAGVIMVLFDIFLPLFSSIPVIVFAVFFLRKLLSYGEKQKSIYFMTSIIVPLMAIPLVYLLFGNFMFFGSWLDYEPIAFVYFFVVALGVIVLFVGFKKETFLLLFPYLAGMYSMILAGMVLWFLIAIYVFKIPPN